MNKKEISVDFGEYIIGAYNEPPKLPSKVKCNVEKIRNSTAIRGGIIFTAYDKSAQVGAVACINEYTPIEIIDNCLEGMVEAGVDIESKSVDKSVWARTTERDYRYPKKENELLEKVLEKYKSQLTYPYAVSMDHYRHLELSLETGKIRREGAHQGL